MAPFPLVRRGCGSQGINHRIDRWNKLETHTVFLPELCFERRSHILSKKLKPLHALSAGGTPLQMPLSLFLTIWFNREPHGNTIPMRLCPFSQLSTSFLLSWNKRDSSLSCLSIETVDTSLLLLFGRRNGYIRSHWSHDSVFSTSTAFPCPKALRARKKREVDSGQVR